MVDISGELGVRKFVQVDVSPTKSIFIFCNIGDFLHHFDNALILRKKWQACNVYLKLSNLIRHKLSIGEEDIGKPLVSVTSRDVQLTTPRSLNNHIYLTVSSEPSF